jgi:hypothetical protein
MAKTGRKPKPGSKPLWIPEEIVGLVSALKRGDVLSASFHYADWVNSQNKASGKQAQGKVNS